MKSEVLSEEDLRVVAKAIRGYRAHRQYVGRLKGHRVRGVDQLDRLERVFTALAEAKRASVGP